MFNQSGDSTPFLHILPAKAGEHFSTFQHRLMLSLHERSHPFRPNLVASPTPPPDLSSALHPAPMLPSISAIAEVSMLPSISAVPGTSLFQNVNTLREPSMFGIASTLTRPSFPPPFIPPNLTPSPPDQSHPHSGGPMETEPSLSDPDPVPPGAFSIPLPELEPKGVKACVIGTNCIGVLTAAGQAGRIKLEVLGPPQETTAEFWTSQDEEVARQLRPQLEAEIPDFNRPPPGAGGSRMFGGLGTGLDGLGGIHSLRSRASNQLREEAADSDRTDLSALLELSEVEWAKEDQLFTHIAVLNSEILLVRCGQLFSWEVGATEVIPHPKSADLQLAGEEIVSLSAAKTRASLITRSNRVATLYDRSITKHTDAIHGNHLMHMLCHPLTAVSLPEGDFLTDVSVSETISCVLSNSGMAFWWGLVSADKKSAAHSSPSGQNIRAGSLVSLRHGAQTRDGSLLLNFSSPTGAALGRLNSSDRSGSDVSVEVLSGGGEEEQTWKLSETVFLEDEKTPPIFGKVVAINREFAAVSVSQCSDSGTSSSESDIQLLPLSELQTVSGEEREEVEIIRTAAGAGVQIDPVCIVEPGEEGEEKRAATTGFRCLAISCHSQGPLLLLERVADGQAFILNSLSSPKLPDPPTVYAGSHRSKTSWTNATIEQESTPAATAGLSAQSKFAASPLTNTPVLLDAHGYIRPIQSFYRLRPPFWHLPLAFESLSQSLISHRQRDFHLVLCHPRKRGVISYVDDFDRAKQFMDACISQSDSSTEEPLPAVKRAKVEPVEKVLVPVKSADLEERSCGNKNILHACILSADRKRTSKKKKKYKFCFEEDRWSHYSKNSYNIRSGEFESGQTQTLSYLLSLPSLSHLVQTLLMQTDASGRTPFLLALLSQDLAAAELILEFVERAPLRQQSHLYQNAVARSSTDGTSPLEALLFNAALPYGQFGLRTLLIQTQCLRLTPNPKVLLSLFQRRYPSAYRCETIAPDASPLSEETKVLPCPTARESPPDRRTYTDTFYVKPNELYRSVTSEHLSQRQLVVFSSAWEMRRAQCELNGAILMTGTSFNNLTNLPIEIQTYHGEGTRSSDWRTELKKRYAKYSRAVIDTELTRVSLFRRLIDVCPMVPGHENILSSLLHDKLLVQYFQDMSKVGEREESDEFKLCFGTTLLSGSSQSSMHSGLFNPIRFGGPTLGLPLSSSPNSKESDGVGGAEEKGERVPVPSILEIVAGSWDVVSSAILNPGGGVASSHADRDSFTFSLLVDTPDAILVTFLRTLFSKLKEIDPDKLPSAFMSADPGEGLDAESARAILVVRRFIQSLVRLYNRSLVSQKQFLIPESPIATDIPNRNPNLTLPVENRVIRVQYRIYRVLSCFRSLSVWEMIAAARGIFWPILVGNPKQYPKDFDPPNLNGISLFNHNAQGVKGLEWHFHCESVQRLSKPASKLPQLPSEGIKLCLLGAETGAMDSSQGAGGKESKERSDYWGEGNALESTSESDETGSESDPTDRADVPQTEEGEEDGSEAEEEEEGFRIAPAAPRSTGTSARVSWLTDTAEQNTQSRGMAFYHTQETGLNSSSSHGANILARSFSRFLKSAVKLCLPEHDKTESSGLDLPVLSLPIATERRILDCVPDILDPVFSWAARLLDLAQNQIEIGGRFNLEARYRQPAPIDDLYEQPNRSGQQMPRSDPKQYTDYLLSLHQLESGDTLPVMDLSSYEHVAYIVDAQLYFANNWSKCALFERQSSQSESSTPVPSSDLPNGQEQVFFLRQPSLIGSKHRHQLSGKPDFKTPLQRDIPLAQKPHLLKPEASASTLFCAPTDTAATTPCDPPVPLHTSPLTYSQLDESPALHPSKLTPKEILSRWSGVIEALSDLFAQSGPGTEPENFLFSRGGFAGRMARFHTLLNSIKNTGYYGGHFSLTIDRSELLKDSLTKLFSLEWAWQQSLNVNFEGEAGGGEGVVAGFYTALANALKSSDKMPPRTTCLFHEPGKLPEQATFYAPAPTLLTNSNPLFVQRLSYYRAIGKFFGIAIYYKQPIPFLLTRHVLKYILGRQISWHDVGFYNADLYEGLRRMLEHCQEENMSQESFQAIYMLNFEVAVNDTICELKPGGKSIPVTPDNVQEYVRLYSMYLMVGCLKEELEELRKGFVTVIPANFIRDLTAEDLQLILTGGSAVVSYSRLKRQTAIQFSLGITEEDRVAFTSNFYRLIRHMKNSQRQQLLYFATGSALLASDSAVLSVYVLEGEYENLPTASTCGRTMRLPRYKNYATLKKKVLEAIQCQDYAFS